MNIGFHLPIAKGFDHTLKEAQRLGCDVVQIFVKNPRSWKEKRLTDADRESFSRLARRVPVTAHLSYLPNLAKIDEEPRNMRALLHEASLCEELGIKRLVVHCGSRGDTKKGIRTIARAVDRVLGARDVSILLETSAGQGDTIGRSIPELAEIRNKVSERQRVYFCLDTAHLFSSGYNVKSRRVWKRVLKEIDEYAGREALAFFHLNDSKTIIGSRVDRHWHIGKGKIGLAAFRYLLREQKFAHLGGVMETPKMGNMDEVNMRTMRSLLPPLVPGPSS